MRRSEILAWLGIAAALLATHTIRVVRGDSISANRNLAGLKLKIAARYYVGAAQLFLSNPSAVRQLYQQAWPQLTQVAPSSISRLRCAIVAGELAGAPEAKRRLTEFLRDASLDPSLREDAATLERVYADSAPPLSAAEKERLVQRHGWYARLAFSRGLAPNDPVRKAATLPAVRTFLALIGAMFLGAGLFIAGLALLIIGIVQCQQGKIRSSFMPSPPTGDGPPWVEAFALYLLAFMVGGAAIMHFWGNWWAVLGWYAIVAVMVFGCLRWRGARWTEIRQEVGLHSGRGWWREAAAGRAGYLAGLPLLAAGALVTYLLVTLAHGTTPMHPIVEWFAHADARTLIPILLLATVIAPLFEEIMFRGMFYRHLRQHLGWLLSALIMAFIFASIHPQGYFAVPALMAIGFTLGCLREWRGSLIAPVCAHALNNGLAFALVWLTCR
ncbi:MAG TPA: type II CAAX endopeptidase family protein [Candidatus Acidoferrum sp.]|jgi:membrane protease YdiL (CAAX protease family)|nr:type II CAAX endopeptidase family protein [Candidatus Acidoferrum sp.]